MNPKKIARIYTTEDVYMTETARVTFELFKADLPYFTKFDTTMTAGYAKDFLAMVEGAETVVADSAVIDQQVTLTEEVDATMIEARSAYNKMKFFILKAYPNSVGTQGEFGLNDYDKARRSRAQMGYFLGDMYTACQKYESQLLAVGCSIDHMVQLQKVRDELIVKNTKQKLFKKRRPKLTEDRIVILNNCYLRVMEVMAAAQLIFENEYAKKNQYVFVHATKSSDKEEYTGEIAPDRVDVIAVVEYDAKASLVFTNTGAIPLTFALSNSDVLEEIEVELSAGATITKTMGELHKDASRILVQNLDKAKEGSYRVVIE